MLAYGGNNLCQDYGMVFYVSDVGLFPEAEISTILVYIICLAAQYLHYDISHNTMLPQVPLNVYRSLLY